jgi:hypothetical protein
MSLESLHIVASVSNFDFTCIGNSGVSEITVDEDSGHYRRVDQLLIRLADPSVILCFGWASQVVIPSDVVVLKPGSFGGRRSLQAVSFEGGSQLGSIEEYAAAFCTSLLSIRLPASLEVIEEDAFWSCSSLVGLTFEAPSKLLVIACDAFGECKALTSITLPGSLRALHERSFRRCRSLKSLTFEPGSEPPGIHPDAFYGCENLEEIYPSEYGSGLRLDNPLL